MSKKKPRKRRSSRRNPNFQPDENTPDMTRLKLKVDVGEVLRLDENGQNLANIEVMADDADGNRQLRLIVSSSIDVTRLSKDKD